MNRPKRTAETMLRLLTLGLAGGCLFQVVGCVSGVTPVVLSFFESATISYVLQTLLN